MSELSANPIKDMIEGDFARRIHTLSPDECSSEAAAGQIEAWRQEGQFTVFNAGTYDLLTLNHILGLSECRTIGAMALMGIDKIETKQDQHLVHEIAASASIALMVTLDTNEAIELSKSRRPEKGGAPKPILDWNSRAMMLAMQSMPKPDYQSRHGIVDYITRHGPGCCGVCAEGSCSNRDNALMAVKLQPSLIVVNAASFNTVRDIEAYKEEGLLPRTQIALTVEEENQYFDPILKEATKTSAIVRRIRS